jgi:hypothetical protein
MAQSIVHSAAPQPYIKSNRFVYGQGLSTQSGAVDTVPLHDPVQFEPATPVAPKDFSACRINSSEVPPEARFTKAVAWVMGIPSATSAATAQTLENSLTIDQRERGDDN